MSPRTTGHTDPAPPWSFPQVQSFDTPTSGARSPSKDSTSDQLPSVVPPPSGRHLYPRVPWGSVQPGGSVSLSTSPCLSLPPRVLLSGKQVSYHLSGGAPENHRRNRTTLLGRNPYKTTFQWKTPIATHYLTLETKTPPRGTSPSCPHSYPVRPREGVAPAVIALGSRRPSPLLFVVPPAPRPGQVVPEPQTVNQPYPNSGGTLVCKTHWESPRTTGRKEPGVRRLVRIQVPLGAGEGPRGGTDDPNPRTK